MIYFPAGMADHHHDWTGLGKGGKKKREEMSNRIRIWIPAILSVCLLSAWNGEGKGRDERREETGLSPGLRIPRGGCRFLWIRIQGIRILTGPGGD